MTDRGEPIYQTRPHRPIPANFGLCEALQDNVFLSEGNSNCYMITTEAGHILINTGMGFEAPVHHANFESMVGNIDGAIRYIILTQGHVDHVGGVQYFRDRNPGLEVIATAANAEHQAYDARLHAFRSARSAFRFVDDFGATFQGYIDAGYSDFNPQDTPTPDITFEASYTFELGGVKVELIAQPGAETNDSLVIWLPQSKACFTGNLFGCPFGHFPNLVTIRGDRYRDALVCAGAVETVRSLGAETIYYGHHAPVEGADLIERELSVLRDAILYVHDETVKGMNAGTDVSTLQQTIALPAELEVGEGYGKVSWGVKAIWESYAGWFHHQSTTELYSVPRSAINADLVELAGEAALTQRATAKFEAGKLEESLHLLDILLAYNPENEEAVQLSIAVHQKLLEAARTFCHTGQFWLEGWLENQIKVLQGGAERSLAEIIK